MSKQKTLKGSFSLCGKGLHTGLSLTVTFNPAPENTGYKIQRIDLEGEPVIQAVAENVVETQRGTVLGKGDIRVSTIEHGMSALYALGIDITKQYIPVVPCAHYLCGGIKVDLNACSSIHRLYAIGECSCTGLHGGNRLASNSLIEAVVYADTAAKHSIEHIDEYDFNDRVPEWNDEGTLSNEEKVLIAQDVKEVEQVMSAYVGIVRSDLRLKRAWTRLDLLYEETEELYKHVKATRDICELRNMINVGYLITRQALERKESRGLHYTIDYPKHAYDQN